MIAVKGLDKQVMMPYTVPVWIEWVVESYTFAMLRASASGDARTPFDPDNRTGLCGYRLFSGMAGDSSERDTIDTGTSSTC